MIAFAGFLAYSNTFSVPFHFDDRPVILENPVIKDIHSFTDPSASRYIGYLSFALNYQLNGLDVNGYHIVNLGIHITNALLVYCLVLLTFQTPYFSKIPCSSGPPSRREVRQGHLIGLFSALLFVSHPIQTQAVTYIVQRFASLSTMFYLFSLVLYIQWRIFSPSFSGIDNPARLSLYVSRVKPALLYLASVLSAVLAMKTKEIAFTLPVIITLYEFLFFEGNIKKRILCLVPILFTLLIIPLGLIPADKSLDEIMGDVAKATRLQSPLSRVEYLFTQFRVIVTYLRLVFLPVNQNIDYDYPAFHSFFEPAVFLSFLFLVSILGLGIYLLYRSRLAPSVSRLIAFGIFWFFITLTIESSIIPIVDVIFEHRVYLPSVGLFIAIITALFNNPSLPDREPAQKGAKRIQITAIAVSVIIVLLIGAAFSRNVVYSSYLSLWRDVVQKSPMKARAHNNLGNCYFLLGKYEDAAREYEEAVVLNSNYLEVYLNLVLVGNELEKNGFLYQAVHSYDIVCTKAPPLFRGQKRIACERVNELISGRTGRQNRKN